MAEEGPLANWTADFMMCLLKGGHLPSVGQLLRYIQRLPTRRGGCAAMFLNQTIKSV